jgi:soluble lytic murein transglycosylase-like protein
MSGGLCMALILSWLMVCGPGPAHAGAPPKIGRLTMPSPWWEIVQDAARRERISPYWIAAVMVIESRYERFAINKKHRCYGLMQIQQDVARALGVTDPFDAEQNIRAGAKILGRLERKYAGDKRLILKKYNPTDDGNYSLEVMRAYRQAKRGENEQG